MSNLKWQTVEQLEDSERTCTRRINELSSQLSGQKTRLEWIKHYLFQKRPQELTIQEIEHRLGHKVIIAE